MKLLYLIIPIVIISNIDLTAEETKDEKKLDLSSLGIKYVNKKTTEPLDNSIHILQIDLKSKLVGPKVELGPDPDGKGKAEASLSDPRKLASHPSVLAFINTNPWDSFPNKEGEKNRSWYLGQPVDIHGLAGTKSIMRSTKPSGNASVWFDEKNFASRVNEDILIRHYLNRRFSRSSIANILISRKPSKTTITVSTSRPGLIIGKGGSEIEIVKKQLKKMLGYSNLQINVNEIKRPGLSAELVGQNIAQQLEKKVN